MESKDVTIRCDCGLEAVVFTVISYDKLENGYELSFEDSYNGHAYKGFFGRLRRAWHAFKGNPVVYNSIYVEDKEKMENFLENCIRLIKRWETK